MTTPERHTCPFACSRCDVTCQCECRLVLLQEFDAAGVVTYREEVCTNDLETWVKHTCVPLPGSDNSVAQGPCQACLQCAGRVRAEQIAQAIEATDPRGSWVHRAAYNRAARIARESR